MFNLALKNIILATLALALPSTLSLDTQETHFLNVNKIVEKYYSSNRTFLQKKRIIWNMKGLPSKTSNET